MTKQNIKTTFAALQAKDDKAFIAYIMAGDGGLDQLENQINALQEAGVDLIELGVPFSDPVADGPVIQAAGIRSLANGTTLQAILKELTKIKASISVPIILMGYLNPMAAIGFEKFGELAREAGVSGVIIPDVPYEEEDTLKPALDANDIALIRLVSLTSDDERISTLTRDAEGFIYAVTVNGTTGVRGAEEGFAEGLDQHLAKLRAVSPIPVCAGFGISSKQTAEKMGEYADGVIVGSQIVQYLHEGTPELIADLIPEKS